MIYEWPVNDAYPDVMHYRLLITFNAIKGICVSQVSGPPERIRQKSLLSFPRDNSPSFRVIGANIAEEESWGQNGVHNYSDR